MSQKKKSKWGVTIPKSRRTTISNQSQSTTELAAELSTLASILNNRIENNEDINETEEAINLQIGLDETNENFRVEINNQFEDDEYFYSDHEDTLKETIENSRTEDFDYEYVNVLNGSTNTFGLEIEIVDGDMNKIAQELYDLDICGSNRQLGYHSRNIEGKWKLERDSSLGSSGGELISPPLSDTPDTWRTIKKVCDVAKKHNAKINSHCGGHIHMSMEPLDTARYRWKRFFKATSSFEPVMYRVAGGDSGHVRQNVRRYAMPFAENASRAYSANYQVSNTEDINKVARLASRYDRYRGINLTNIYSDYRPNTIEMRYFNSSLTPGVIQTNVKIANGIIFASEKARTGNESQSEAMKRRGNILLSQNSSNNPDNHNKIRDFVDIAFTRKKDKDAVLKLYSKNNWHNY